MRHRHVVAEREGPRELLVVAQEVQVVLQIQVRLVLPLGRLALESHLLPKPLALRLLFGLELLSQIVPIFSIGLLYSYIVYWSVNDRFGLQRLRQ